MLKLQQQFLIRVNYKSGIQEQFWVSDFTWRSDGCSWKHVEDKMKPIRFSVDDVESVWQVGLRKRWVLK